MKNYSCFPHTLSDFIIKLFLAFVLVAQLSCSSIDKNFKVYGDEKLLKNMVINVGYLYESSKGNSSSISSILYKGKHLNTIEKPYTYAYNIFISQGNNVGVLEVDNLYPDEKDRVNYLLVKKLETGLISVQYFAYKAEFEKGNGRQTELIPLPEFYKKNSISEDKQNVYKHYFFDNIPE